MSSHDEGIFDPKTFLKNLTQQPGIYQFFSADNKVLYVGKARNLKKRVGSYFQKTQQHPKTKLLLSYYHHVEVTVTPSEHEALILENNLIKKLKPRYNILLRDDKSYPYIYLSTQHTFPRLDIYRGRQSSKGKFYGPFPNAKAVRESLNLLQKLFKLRQCRDSFFNARTRPCLQYQIKRCTAPCVNYINAQDYDQSVRLAQLFLDGKNQEIIDELIVKMEVASEAQDYESAAHYRDQVSALRTVQQKQFITKRGGNIDVIAICVLGKEACVQVMTIRAGRLIGGKSFFPKMVTTESMEMILNAFIPQYYLNTVREHHMPQEIICNVQPSETSELERFLSQHGNARVQIRTRVRNKAAQWLSMAEKNAQISLSAHMSSKATMFHRFESLTRVLELPDIPERLECFDISHTMGEATVASCVVFNREGPLSSDYRRYNIKNITKGDDYAAMYQALSRRYQKLKMSEALLPDILLIDGGKGQLHEAQKVMEELQVSGVMLVGVSKGEGRKPGLETLHLLEPSRKLQLPSDDLALLLIQHIRDEAHRFAITGHRQKREKKRQRSMLEDVPGIGAKRRAQLLKQFGGMQGLKVASVKDLSQIPGISETLAQRLFDALHG